MGGGSCLALIYGWGGKTAINCFVLVTGYFMCRQEFKWQKLIHLYCEVKFYRIVIYLIFLILGYEDFSLKECYKALFGVAYEFGKGFTSSFIAFYALVPFINKFIGSIEHKLYKRLLITLVVIFSIIPTFLLNSTFEYISWYVTLYLIAAYIRLYPCKIFDDKRISGIFALVFLLLSWVSVAFIYFVSVKVKRILPYYYFVADSNKILALLTSVFAFCFFKNISLGKNKFINTISSTTFGILLIHASSDTMRKWLWQDVCNNVWHFENDKYFMLHALTCTICVFVVCVAIDLIRQFLQKRITGLILCLKTKQSQ